MKNKRQKSGGTGHKRSLRTSMALLIIFCWVLPIMAIVGVSGAVASNATRNHVAELLSVSIENAMDTVRRDLDANIEDAMTASYVPTVRQAYSRYLLDSDSAELYKDIRGFLQQYANNSSLRGAYLLFGFETDAMTEGNRYYALNRYQTDFNDAHSFYKGEMPTLVRQYIETMEAGDIEFVMNDGRFYLVRVMALHGNRYENYAGLALEINPDLLFETLYSLPWLTGAQIQLGDTMISLYEGDNADELLPLSEQKTIVTRQNTLQMVGTTQSSRFTLQYSVYADMQPLLANTSTSWGILALMALLCIPFLYAVYHFFHRKISRPLSDMGAFAFRIEEGEFGIQMAPGSLTSSEMDALANCLNGMSGKLEYQFERIYREQLALRDAEIKALQSQINPHFLGNTLEIINWEARLAGNAKVSRMLEALSTMIEAALDRKKRPLVHLSEELMYVNSYLYIIKERLGKRLEVLEEIDETLQDCFVPRLILQPIIENAVEHGLAVRTHGVITIRAVREEDGWMRLEVENNRPLSKQDEENIRRLLSNEEEAVTSLNIGIRNVNQRLRIIYGPESGLSVKNNKIGHTVSSMRIRIKQEEQF